MNPWLVVGLAFGVIFVLSASGLLSRIFLNLLEAAAIVTMTAWILLLVTGIVMFCGFPFYCGMTGTDIFAFTP